MFTLKLKSRLSIFFICALISKTAITQASPTDYILKGQIENVPKNIKTISFMYYRDYFSNNSPNYGIELTARVINGIFLLHSNVIDKL